MSEARVTKMVGIAEFKAKCERLLSQMERDGEPIELTRRGKVVGVIRPPAASEKHEVADTAFGCLRGTATIHGDLDAPLDPDWSARLDAGWDAGRDVR